MAGGALDEQRTGRGVRHGRRLGVRGDLEGSDGVAVLGMEPEGLATGGQQRQRRSSGQQFGDQRGSREQVLEVVEHEQRVLRSKEPLDRPIGVLSLQRCGLERLRDRARDVLCVRDCGERDEPCAVLELGLEPAGNLESQPRLAHSAGADERDQPDVAPAQQRPDLLSIRVAAKRPGRRQGQPARTRLGRLRRSHGKVGILRKDRALEVAQTLARLDAQILDQGLASVLIGLERSRLPLAAVQSEHQLGTESLPVGVLADERLELPDQLGMAAERQLCLVEILDRGHTQVLQPRDLTLRELLGDEVGERRAAP